MGSAIRYLISSLVRRARRPAALMAGFSLAMLLALIGAPLVALAQDGPPIRVTTTTGMIADLARNVGGERVAVESLMGPGVDPHLYRPSAGDIRKLEDADLILYNGLELEGRMTDLLGNIGRSGKPAIPVAEAIPEEELRPSPQYQGQFDPHIWFDVTLWQMAAQRVKEALVEVEPASEALFQENLDAYLAGLEALDQAVHDAIQQIPEEQRVLVTAHDAFGYFGDQYGIEVLGLQGMSTASEATAGDIQAMAELIVERQVPAIFVESSVPPATVEAVQAAVRDRGFEVVIGGSLFSDAMGAADTPEGTYLGMVRHNVDTIVQALAPAAVATPAA